MRRPLWLLGVVTLFSCGCGSDKFVPVSGQVTLDGVPLAGATVNFQPMSEGDNVNPGVGSWGKTDDNGRFALEVVGQHTAGALVGKHKVRITKYQGDAPSSSTDDRSARTPAQLVPKKYNTNTTLEFPVPRGGTDQANFPLTGDAPAKKP